MYAILALSVGLWACVDIIPEVRKYLFEHNNLEHTLYDSPFLFFLVLLLLATVLAPIFVVMLLTPTWRSAMVKGMVQQM